MRNIGATDPDPSDPPGALPHNLSRYHCVDFVNSRFTDHTGSGETYDRLVLPEFQLWYADRCGLPLKKAASAASMSHLMRLRGFLRDLLDTGRLPSERRLAELNEYLDAAEQVWELVRLSSSCELRLRWRHAHWSAVIAATVASYGELLNSGDGRYVKRCENPQCSWLFVDESRNASRRWCDAAICGNLMKVRAHRARLQRDTARRRDGHGARVITRTS
jgi:predicted RNA-binding Zn ribbon-like protein